MKAIFSRVRHPSHPGRGHGSLTCHMTQFERSDWLRSENFTNIMIEYLSLPLIPASGTQIYIIYVSHNWVTVGLHDVFMPFWWLPIIKISDNVSWLHFFLYKSGKSWYQVCVLLNWCHLWKWWHALLRYGWLYFQTRPVALVDYVIMRPYFDTNTIWEAYISRAGTSNYIP